MPVGDVVTATATVLSTSASGIAVNDTSEFSADQTVVATPSLQSITVTPANPSVPDGETEQFTAIGTYSDQSTQNLTSQVTWASATSSVATITSGGLATAVATTGSSTISATLDGITGSTVMTVTSAALESIAVTPANPGVGEGLDRSSSPPPGRTRTTRRRI